VNPSLERLQHAAEKLKAKRELGRARSKSLVDFTEYRDDPARFVVEVLGVESAVRRSDGVLYQRVWLQSVLDHPRNAFLTGYGCGKTRFLAMASAWWLVTRPYSKVVICAPQLTRQVSQQAFAELRRVVRRATVRLPIEAFAHFANVEGHSAGEWGIIGLPATEPDRIEGQHAEGGLLLMLDETKGISQGVFDALQGALSGGDDSRLVVASTPGGTSGPFWKACNSSSWQVHTLSSEDSSLVSPQWCEDRANEWGKESALYVTRVQGRFADTADGQLFGLDLLDKSSQRSDQPSTGDVVLGVDVSRSVAGDQNCVCVCRGGRVERFVLWRSPDLEPTIARIIQEALATSPKLIRIDAGGLGGGPADRLRALGFQIEAVNFGAGASDPSRYANKRSELYWSLREALERGSVTLPDDDELMADLTAIRYSFSQNGKVQLVSKEEIRQKLGRSPDRSDALVLATFVARGSPWNWAGHEDVSSAWTGGETAPAFEAAAEIEIKPDGSLGDPVLVSRQTRAGYYVLTSPTVETYHMGNPPPNATFLPPDSGA
jgi:phage terminase large subunit